MQITLADCAARHPGHPYGRLPRKRLKARTPGTRRGGDRLLALKLAVERPPTILCIGAHCDDIEIGCGGTLVRWAREYPNARVIWAIFAGEAGRMEESRHAAARLLSGLPGLELRFFAFRGSYFPAEAAAIKDAFESLKGTVSPDVVLTHFLHDRHQDHAVLSELTWNTFRSHLILEYEIPKYEGDLGHPNLFVPLSREDLARKVDVLMECFPSQRARAWFTEDTFRGLARLRGIECAAASGFAEAFHARKACL
jgi:LmbE family N-acetylglucosaminyl deacetylase